MKKLPLILLVLAGALFYSYFVFQDYQSGHGLIGQPAPEINLHDSTGKNIKLSDHRGKVVLIHFWASWCPPCVTEIPSLGALQKKFSPDDFVLMAISMDENVDQVLAFKQKVPFDFPIILDPSFAAADPYKTYKLPESILVDRRGIIVKKIVGPQDWESPIWQALIKKYL